MVTISSIVGYKLIIESILAYGFYIYIKLDNFGGPKIYSYVFPGINVGAVFSIADDDIPHNKKYKETAVTFNIHGNPFKIDDLLFRWLNSMKNESNLDQF